MNLVEREETERAEFSKLLSVVLGSRKLISLVISRYTRGTEKGVMYIDIQGKDPIVSGRSCY